MKNILLWDPRFADLAPRHLSVDDGVAFALVRAGVAAAADPALAGELAIGAAALDPIASTPLIEIALTQGACRSTTRVSLPCGAAVIAIIAGTGAEVGNVHHCSGVVTPPPAPTVDLSAAQAKAEGDTGITLFAYTVTRSTAKGATSVAWSFEPGTTSASDFAGGLYPVGGSVTLADGVDSGTFTITISGDPTVEPDETFTVSIAAPSGYASGARMSATGTVLNDDVTVTPPPAGTFAADVPYQNVRTNAAEGEVLWRVNALPTAISPNDGRFAYDTVPDADGMYAITRSTGFISPGFLNVRTTAADGQTTTVPVTIVTDRMKERTKFRGRVPDRVQWEVDLQTQEIDKGHANVHVGAKTHGTVKSGRWNDPTVWDTGTVPHSFGGQTKQRWNHKTKAFEAVAIGSANVYVNAGHTLTIDSQAYFNDIHSAGTSMVIIDTPDESTSVDIAFNNGVIHGKWIVRHKGGETTTDATPRVALTYKNLMLMGPRRWYGAPKAMSGFTNGDIPAGATSATIPGASTFKWRPGDFLCLPSTDDASWGATTTAIPPSPPHAYFFYAAYTGYAVDEQRGDYLARKHVYRRLVSVVGDTVTWDEPLDAARIVLPLTVDGQTVDQHPEIINCSRSIERGGWNPFERLERAATMGMVEDDAETWYVGIRDGGQTVINATLKAPSGDLMYTDASQSISITDAANLIGAYGDHEHFTGAQITRRLIPLVGCVAYNPSVPFQGVAFRSHGSRHALQDCASIDYTAIGWSAENPNDISQLENFVAVGCTGDGYGRYDIRRQSFMFKHDGHQGAAMDCQSRAVSLRNVRAYGCVDTVTFVQNNDYSTDGRTRNYYLSAPESNAMLYTDPMVYRGSDVNRNDEPRSVYEGYGSKDGAMPIMENIRGIGCARVVRIQERSRTDRTNTAQVVFRGVYGFGCDQWFTFDTYVNGYVITGGATRQARGGTAFFMAGAATWNIVVRNSTVDNYHTAYDVNQAGRGYQIWFYNLTFGRGVERQFTQADLLVPNADGKWHHAHADGQIVVYDKPTDVPSYELIDNWYAADGVIPHPTTWGAGVYPRLYRNMQAADLPVMRTKPGGPNEYGGVDPRPVEQRGAASYWFDPATIGSLDYNAEGWGQLAVQGAIIDSLGIQSLGGNDNGEGVYLDGLPQGKLTRKSIGHRSPAVFVRDNGLWDDNGQLKIRVHFLNWDRITDVPFRGHFDVPVYNVPADVREKHLMADPNDGMQPIPQLEELRARPFLPRRAPVITSVIPATFYGSPGQPLRIPLRADQPGVAWVFGGPDAASVAKVTVDHLPYLDFAPGAGQAVGQFDITIAARDPISGISLAPQPCRIVLDNHTLIDNFDYVGDVTTGPHAAIYQATPGQLYSNGDGTATFGRGSCNDLVQVNAGSTSHYVEFQVKEGHAYYPVFTGYAGNDAGWTLIQVLSGSTRSYSLRPSGTDIDYNLSLSVNDVVRIEQHADIRTVFYFINGILKHQRPSSSGNLGTGPRFYSCIIGDQNYEGSKLANLRMGPL